MSVAAQITWLPDGTRLHMHHGPIDLIVGAEGPGRAQALRQGAGRFETILDELVGELPLLRQPLAVDRPQGPVARRMCHAVAPFAAHFVTPMAAVAGAVADEVLAAMRQGTDLTKAYVNNGGDIAFHLRPGAQINAYGPAGSIAFRESDTPRGLATSGWRGRSHSLGIACAVTVAAKTAAAADVAATLIANAVDLPGHPAISRCPARDLSPDSDLGERLVTTHVESLSPAEIDQALGVGTLRARTLLSRNLICGATLSLQGEIRTVAPETTPSKGHLAHA